MNAFTPTAEDIAHCIIAVSRCAGMDPMTLMNAKKTGPGCRGLGDARGGICFALNGAYGHRPNFWARHLGWVQGKPGAGKRYVNGKRTGGCLKSPAFEAACRSLDRDPETVREAATAWRRIRKDEPVSEARRRPAAPSVKPLAKTDEPEPAPQPTPEPARPISDDPLEQAADAALKACDEPKLGRGNFADQPPRPAPRARETSRTTVTVKNPRKDAERIQALKSLAYRETPKPPKPETATATTPLNLAWATPAAIRLVRRCQQLQKGGACLNDIRLALQAEFNVRKSNEWISRACISEIPEAAA